jgi:hypothetical protein
MYVTTRSQLISCLTPEQRLLISVCSAEKSIGREEVKDLLIKPFRWERLILLSERHRLLPMLYKNIRAESVNFHIEIPSILKEKFIAQTQHVLQLATEGVRISNILNRDGIQSILLKGPFLSQQIYGDDALRPSRDIDILILPDSIERVNEILRNEGYRRVYPDFELSKKQKIFYQHYKNQYAYRNPHNGCLIEIHWRLFSQKSLFPTPTEQVFAERQELNMAGSPIHVLSKKHCFEYLCLHGSLHQWFRLLWLRDIAQFLGNKEDNLDELLINAKKNGNERPVEQAIILSNLFFGSPDYSAITKSNNLVKSITNFAVNAAISNEQKTLSQKITRLRIPFYKIKLKRSINYKLSCWSILHPNFNDWKRVKLPDSLFFLYFFLRPFIWFYTFYIEKKKQNG